MIDNFLLGILYLVSVAFFITLFFTLLLKNRGPWGKFWTFFIIILLAVFAADVWIKPAGRYIYNEIQWIPSLAVGLLFALLLAAAVPSPRARSKMMAEKEKMPQKRKPVGIPGTYFWILFILLLLLIVLGYYVNVRE